MRRRGSQRGWQRAKAAGGGEAGREQEERGGEERGEGEEEREASARGGGGAARVEAHGHGRAPRRVLTRVSFFIKDGRRACMGARGSRPIDADEEDTKKRRRETDVIPNLGADRAVEETETDEGDDLVIISNIGGDKAVDEIEADSVGMVLRYCGMSVRSYVCVASCSLLPILTAYETYAGKRYVKRIFPRTNCLRNMNGSVMVLLCHGMHENGKDKTPSYICFHDGLGVASPHESRIWSCSSVPVHVHGEEFKTPDDGVTLSEVVGRSKLVIMLCCYGEDITDEYEASSKNTHEPDLLIFKCRAEIKETSTYVFLALLLTSIERCRVYIYLKLEPWDDFVRRHIYQVLLWIKTKCTDVDTLWEFLMEQECVSHGPQWDLGEYRIKGCIYVWKLDHDVELQILHELRLVSLGLWSDGSGASPRGYTWVDSTTHTEQELGDLMSALPLRRSKRFRLTQRDVDLDSLLRQLRGLLRGA